MRPPIAPPEPTPAIRPEPRNERVFRVRYWPLVAFIATFSFLMGTGTFFLLRPIAPHLTYSLSLASTGSVAYALLTAAASIVIAPIKISPYFIQGCNFWGNPRRFEWSEITQTRFSRALVLSAVRVTTPKGRALYVPLVIHNLPAFAAAVREFAPPENPLRSYFEEHPPR